MDPNSTIGEGAYKGVYIVNNHVPMAEFSAMGLQRQIDNQGYAECGVTLTKDGDNLSGEMTTTLTTFNVYDVIGFQSGKQVIELSFFRTLKTEGADTDGVGRQICAGMEDQTEAVADAFDLGADKISFTLYSAEELSQADFDAMATVLQGSFGEDMKAALAQMAQDENVPMTREAIEKKIEVYKQYIQDVEEFKDKFDPDAYAQLISNLENGIQALEEALATLS